MKKHKKELKGRYRVGYISIFGSYARGEQTEKSDIDIIVEFDENNYPSFSEYLELIKYLEKILGLKVDLITKNSIHNPYIKKSIEEDLIYV
ncbi:DNA polymerase beta domain protein region [Methanocaldococcus vulcanius M7]|uniref:protein adenylyltransferase n=1 Tax=Methanocaldococcus vulcanius (strain ATCC 700851 / DSM 12094 / M7) TaxID=579137 RepID=C9RHZ8_METVM|nr:DNA polymerase beta domain protein region [Methanocaldococcus vulcanius M7]